MGIDFQEIWDQAVLNAAKLDRCQSPHDFAVVKGDRRAACRKCGGDVNADCARWYIEGLAHARPKEIENGTG